MKPHHLFGTLNSPPPSSFRIFYKAGKPWYWGKPNKPMSRSELSSTLAGLNYSSGRKIQNCSTCKGFPFIILRLSPSGLHRRVHFRFLFRIWKAQFQRLRFSHPCQYHRLKCDTGTWLHTFFKPEPVILQNVRGGPLSSHTLKCSLLM